MSENVKDEYKGLERRLSDRRDPDGDAANRAFDRAVTVAVGQVTEKIASAHRWRSTIQATAIAVILSGAAMLALWFAILQPATRSAARENATYNCQLIQGVAYEFSQFIQSDSTLRNKQSAKNVGGRIVEDLVKLGVPVGDLTKLTDQSKLLNTQTVADWQSKIVPAFNSIAAANCSKHLK